MWIFLTKKLSVKPSPPKLSMFWSTPWPWEDAAKKQIKICQHCERPLGAPGKKHSANWGASDEETLYKLLLSGAYEAAEEMFAGSCDCEKPRLLRKEDSSIYTLFGKEHNYLGARKIQYRGNDIRVFPDEFTVVEKGNMKLYVLGTEEEEPSHDLVQDKVAQENGEAVPETEKLREVLSKVMDTTEIQDVLDAALLDGANERIVLLALLGADVTSETIEFPPLGWYRCKPEYATIYCHAWEMTEE